MYSDLLDNEKIDHLRVPLVKTWLKLLALANVNKPRGRLPELKRIAYRLRMSETQVSAAIAELKASGLIDKEGDTFAMHDWDDWQKDSDARATDGRQKRGDSAADAPHKGGASAAVAPPRVDRERERDKEREVEVEEKPLTRRNIFVLYDNYMGRPSVTPMMRDILIQAEEDYPDECITHCFLAAGRASDGRRSWAYVESILKRHQAEGCNERKPMGRNAISAPQVGDAAAILAGYNGGFAPVYIPNPGTGSPGLATLDAGDDPSRLEGHG